MDYPEDTQFYQSYLNDGIVLVSGDQVWVRCDGVTYEGKRSGKLFVFPDQLSPEACELLHEHWVHLLGLSGLVEYPDSSLIIKESE